MSAELAGNPRFRAVMDAAIDAIIIIDKKGLIQDCNQTALRMFGYEAEQICGKNVSMLMPLSFARAHDGYLHAFLQTGQARIIGLGREVVALRSDGVEFPVDLAVGVVRENDEIIGFAGFMRDLTERKAVEAQLKAQQAELADQRERLIHAGRLGTVGEMAAGIAHEVNQPLTAIANYARASIRMLKQTPMPIELLQSTLHKVADQAERAGEIVRGLRRFSRRQSQPMQAVNLVALLDELRPLLRIELGSVACSMEFNWPQEPAWVLAEPIQLQQVILNLVGNAIDAIKEGGGDRVYLRLRAASDEWWRVEVEDNGPGVSAELREELFHPFVTSKAEGLGLGLSICHSIVMLHGGELSCASSEPGKTVFCMLLPAMDPEVSSDG